MHLYKTSEGNILHHREKYYLLSNDWDFVINRNNLYAYLLVLSHTTEPMDKDTAVNALQECLLPPIGSQELWAAGVTYLRSRNARMEESEDSGAADCYQRVYEADRPELFFKALPHRVSGHEQPVNIRKDSSWNVPEPELVLYINSAGVIQAYTIGNDMSSRSIEGENPLYLPQAKMYERSAALGPGLYVAEKPIDPETIINMKIYRGGALQFEDATTLSRMKRGLTELAGWLYKEFDFTAGCFLMTGTCLVPDSTFTLQTGDTVDIAISGIGLLRNTISTKQ